MNKDGLAKSSDSSIEKEGLISQNLSKDGIPNKSLDNDCLLYTSPSPRDRTRSRMPSSA